MEPVWRWQWVGRFVSGLHGKLGLLSQACMDGQFKVKSVAAGEVGTKMNKVAVFAQRFQIWEAVCST